MLQETRSAPDGRSASELAPASVQVLDAIIKGCAAFAPLGATARGDRLRHQIDAGAWTDAALLMVALELPEWHVRRVQWDDGEWYCSLTRHPAIPAEFGEAIDGRNALLPLAIIDALMEAKRQPVTRHPAPPMGDWGREAAYETVWCENAS